MWVFRALPDKRSVRTQTLLAATKAVQQYMRFTNNDSSGEANLLPGSAVSFPNGRHIFLIFLFFILLEGSFLPRIGRLSVPCRAVFRPIGQRRLRRKPIIYRKPILGQDIIPHEEFYQLVPSAIVLFSATIRPQLFLNCCSLLRQPIGKEAVVFVNIKLNRPTELIHSYFQNAVVTYELFRPREIIDPHSRRWF